MSYTKIIEDIENLPHFRTIKCQKCDYEQDVYILTIDTNCQKCSTSLKLRAYGSIGSEIEDVIDAVLTWLGAGQELDLALTRKNIIDQQFSV